MAVTLKIDNYRRFPIAHPLAPNIHGFASGSPGTRTALYKQVNADDYDGRFDYMAGFGVLVYEDGTLRPGAEEITAAGPPVANDTHVVLVDTDAPGFTITLPPAATVGADHHMWIYMRTDGGGNLTIDGSGADTVLGAPNVVLTTQGQMLALTSDGVSNWAAQDASFASSAATSGYRVSGLPPYNLEPAQTLQINIDAGGVQTFTFNATAATLTSGNGQNFNLNDGETLVLEVDGVEYTATFNTADFSNINAASAAEVGLVIEADVPGVTAVDNAGNVLITTLHRGSTATLEVTGGTAAAAFNFPAGVQSGGGDVEDIDAVTMQEAVDLINATITDGYAASYGTRFVISADSTGATSTVEIVGGTAAAALGLSGTGTGTDA